MRLRLRLRPTPRWGSLLPGFLAGLRGLFLRGEEGKGKVEGGGGVRGECLTSAGGQKAVLPAVCSVLRQSVQLCGRSDEHQPGVNSSRLQAVLHVVHCVRPA